MSLGWLSGPARRRATARYLVCDVSHELCDVSHDVTIHIKCDVAHELTSRTYGEKRVSGGVCEV